MRKLFLSIIICLISSSCFAVTLSGSVAIELQEQGRFTGIIGKAYITEKALEVVTFAERDGEIIPFAFIYEVIEREGGPEGFYKVKCKNQLGVITTGSIDLRDLQKPKILLTTCDGITITNISDDGRKFKERFIPKVSLGK